MLNYASELRGKRASSLSNNWLWISSLNCRIKGKYPKLPFFLLINIRTFPTHVYWIYFFAMLLSISQYFIIYLPVYKLSLLQKCDFYFHKCFYTNLPRLLSIHNNYNSTSSFKSCNFLRIISMNQSKEMNAPFSHYIPVTGTVEALLTACTISHPYNNKCI